MAANSNGTLWPEIDWVPKCAFLEMVMLAVTEKQLYENAHESSSTVQQLL